MDRKRWICFIVLAALLAGLAALPIAAEDTVFFTAVVNAVALRKVKHLKLTDVA